MARTEQASHPLLQPGDTIAIVAGSGQLPIDLAKHLRDQGIPPLVVMVEGEAAPELSEFDHETIALEEFPGFLPLLRRRKVTHAVFAGGIGRRPRLRDLKLTFAFLTFIPRALMALKRGDDGLLRTIAGVVEGQGIKVLGAHQIMPDLLAKAGSMTRVAPTKADFADIRAAEEAALAIGLLDIGQAAVAVGGRAIALEGIEGTEGLLQRVKDLRSHGRIAGRKRGVLAKCSKPGQEERLDLPTIGPQTVRAAHEAGLAGIAVEAGHSLVVDFGKVVEEADRFGMFVFGLAREDGR
ncbi:MAG: UDP-2,3-diacylglucosamine diphosphatase LpxI [Alphaproteobacteria bacterium]|nr:UDP-2,3-diacylglucosamine diphosphatase LpxI [Alphaproteobacteria bacterium]MBU0802792.1 UDP-2,3-diacylglucosamine diphosphatase LpxI [Alphaproteobacteria bacterium]MBU0871589.1 UDP-2,3-diacylglucosamine diphosphatase LpxI [Alphaproteobacteria bacterium]MBU1400256.1 UDP-2,3-diacylglucosamine diphosphatase LpxI [Alphaproteobacteria bacterium]MBU1591376.1 UDP-2,3-diacylglucosamine diphosphatase LpxI [Alphaproteobacteria bacterium]